MRNLLIFFCLLHSFFLCAQEQTHIVYFESGKDSISQQEAVTLDSMINLLDRSKSYIVEVTGHTDSIGGKKYNQALSKRRATRIQEYINKSKISFDISVMWKAYFSPAESNASEGGLGRNRRVEIKFTEVIFKKDIWDMPVQEFNISASKAYLLHTKNGCKITVKPGSFRVNTGDTVQILITEYNDPTDFLAGGLPMSYKKGREEFMYQSEQMMKIEAMVDGRPVELLQMIGLECPDIEVLDGLRLYKFHGEKESFVEVRQKMITGLIEELKEEEPKKEEVEEAKESSGPKVPANKTKESKEETKPSKNSKTNKSTTKSNKSKKSKSKKKRSSKPKKGKQKKVKVKRTREKKVREKKVRIKKTKKKRVSIEDEFDLEPDTGRTFLLEPDTTRGFLLEPDTGRGSASIVNINTKSCLSLLDDGSGMLCNIDTFKKIVEFGLALNGVPIPIDLETDLNSYFTRYKSPRYHGMTLRCRVDSNQLNYVGISIKKRFLRRQIVLKFENTPDHPEYQPLKNTKWIVWYRKSFKDLKRIRDLQINDFRILSFKKSTSSKKPKEGYYIELKGEKEMFRFPAKAKKKKKSAIAFKEFRKLYYARVNAFDNKIRQFFDDKKVVRHFQLYGLFRGLSRTREHPCFSSRYVSSCLDFSITNLEPELESVEKNLNALSKPDDCLPLRKANCDEQYFLDWIKYYNANRKQIQKQIEKLNNDLPKYFNCFCGIDTVETDLIGTNPQVDPCYKWEYADVNSAGNKITYIGLGIYNFDYVFRLDEKQVIKKPVFLTPEGDTILTCWDTTIGGLKQTGCKHQIFSIIPNFNGLLKHQFLPRISLIRNKENILFLTTVNKRYKCYVDLREQENFIGNTFIVEEITEETKTLDGLREELTKVN